MEQIEIEQLEKDFKQEYVRLLDMLVKVIYANRDLSVSDINDGERLESAHALASKFFGHALTVLYLSYGTNQELPSLKWHSVDFASIDVITRAALEAFLIFHHVFYASAEPEEKNYRYWTYRAEGMANRQSIGAFAGTKKERQQFEEEKKGLAARLESNQIFQSLSTKQKGQVFEGNGMWRWKPDNKKRLAWRAIGIEAGFGKVLANNIYNILCGAAHSTSIGVRQTFPTLNKRGEEHLYAGTVAIMNIVTANLIQEYCELFSGVGTISSKDIRESKLVNKWIQRGRTLDKLMGV